MARPSRNIDQLLLDAGLALLPTTGCRNFSVRQLVQHAGVNLGMFHYHFKTKDNFVRAVLQRVYEEMFSELVVQVNASNAALTNLRNLLRTLARFARKHRLLMVRLVSEAMIGETLAADFLKSNLPRHFKLIAEQVVQGQREGSVVNAPLPQVMAFIVGAVAAPLLMGSAMQQHGLLPPAIESGIASHVLSKKALEERIEMVLRGLAAGSEKTT
ncbi:MAG: TetR/AcrR family transcriptional regulator [Acidobacteriota bacterium]